MIVANEPSGGGRRRATLAFASLGALGAFALVQRRIHPVRGSAFDRALMRSAGRMRTRATTVVAKCITALGGVTGAVVTAVSAIALVRNDRRDALQMAIGALGGVGAEAGLKQAFGRSRPTLLAHLEQVTSMSFPSGHAMAAAALHLSIALVGSRLRPDLRGPLLVGCTATAGLIGLSRVYLGVHWPTDVLGGLALGTGWACAVGAVFDHA